MYNNDEIIIQLKSQIYEKKKILGNKPIFSPKTKCIFIFNNISYNINVLKQSELELLHVQLFNLNKMSELLNYNLQIDNCLVIDLIDDVVSKLSVIKYNNNVKQLEQLESKLTNLMSEGKKTELELDLIKDLLKNI